MASLKDIATELNVSPSLVSKVLNDRMGNTGARPDKIRAIRDMAEQIGYRKNVSAAALRAGRQHTIGVFVHRLGRSGTGLIEAMLEGISEQARGEQYRLMLHFFHTSDEFRELRKQLHSGVVDGLILAGLVHPDLSEDARHFKRNGIPVISVHDVNVAPSILNIGMNQVEVGRLATMHLVERGCRRIGHVHQSDARYTGYRQALEDAGIGYDPALVYHAPKGDSGYSSKEGELAVANWLSRKVIFDGVFASSDEQAVGAMHSLIRAGVRVPEQVRIVGVDDAPYCEFAMVPLSSVCQCYRERGREAVRLLLDGHSPNSKPTRRGRSIEFTPKLRPRRSSE